jgi:hypothetical protein
MTHKYTSQNDEAQAGAEATDTRKEVTHLRHLARGQQAG